MQEREARWFDAVQDNDVEAMRSLLSQGVDINATQNGQTALMQAAGNGWVESVRFLLENNADLNIREDGSNATVLMKAAEYGDTEIIALLMREKAYVAAEDNDRKRALDYAELAGNQEAADLLKGAGATNGPIRTVLVLGAGFTKAFLPGAPLLVDNYDIEATLTSRYRSFPYAHRILQAELKRHGNGNVDLERLMTRLDGGMPYDRDQGAQEQLRMLRSDIQLHFLRRLEQAKQGPYHWRDLHELAEHCLLNRVTCITFNYDDLLDEALWDQSRYTRPMIWDPNTGYGFMCKASDGLNLDPDRSTQHVLKLHGSINWRMRLGAAEPYRIDDLVHHEEWWLRGTRGRDEHGNHQALYPNRLPDAEMIERLLEREPFIVPPILTKSALNEQPILRRIWSLAFQAIQNAERIIFVGYSLPMTDIAASFLFGEATERLASPPQIQVVDYRGEPNKRMELIDTYRKLFPYVSENDFRFDGALAWAKDFVAEHVPAN